jgi:hypothetical protein
MRRISLTTWVVAGLLLAGALAWGLYAAGHSDSAVCPPGNPDCGVAPPGDAAQNTLPDSNPDQKIEGVSGPVDKGVTRDLREMNREGGAHPVNQPK